MHTNLYWAVPNQILDSNYNTDKDATVCDIERAAWLQVVSTRKFLRNLAVRSYPSGPTTELLET